MALAAFTFGLLSPVLACLALGMLVGSSMPPCLPVQRRRRPLGFKVSCDAAMQRWLQRGTLTWALMLLSAALATTFRLCEASFL